MVSCAGHRLRDAVIVLTVNVLSMPATVPAVPFDFAPSDPDA